MVTPITLDAVREAAKCIEPYAHRTPVMTCAALDERAGRRLFFKCENFQKIGAFKFRGACNAVMKLADDVAGRGVVTHSSGNHAQALALACAVARAELLPQPIRQMWGLGDPGDVSHQDLFRTHYKGRRYSFGYPACPRLEDQEQLFRLLDVYSNIGVELTEGFMMDPESSVSALVLHHPDAKYFNLSEQDIQRLEVEAIQPAP